MTINTGSERSPHVPTRARQPSPRNASSGLDFHRSIKAALSSNGRRDVTHTTIGCRDFGCWAWLGLRRSAAARGGDGCQIPKRPIASPILRASATTSRPASSIARTDRLTAGRNKCTTNASVISAAADVVSRDGCPAMLSSVSFAAAAPIIVSPTVVGLDRTLRTCVLGAAAARRIAPPNAAITRSVTRFESALEIPYTAVMMRWRNSFNRLDTMIASPHSRLGRLTCSRRTGGADWVAGIPDARSDQVWTQLASMARPQSLWATSGSQPRGGLRLRPRPWPRSGFIKFAGRSHRRLDRSSVRK